MRLIRALARRRQGAIAAAVCCRWDHDALEFGLVTTKDGGRWTFPKGHRERGETLALAAAREAFEEAGVVGVVDDRCLLTYRYPGRTGDDLVAAYLLHVTAVGPAQEGFRHQLWCDAATARVRLAEGRDSFHAQELGRVLGAALGAAPASRQRTTRRSGRRSLIGRGRSPTSRLP